MYYVVPNKREVMDFSKKNNRRAPLLLGTPEYCCSVDVQNMFGRSSGNSREVLRICLNLKLSGVIRSILIKLGAIWSLLGY